MTSAWFVVQTHSHSENKAAEHLSRQGFGVYLPRYRKLRRHARRVETIAAPLFPRYLFVAVDMASQRWRAIQSTVGVANLLHNGDEPAHVADGVVEKLRARHDGDGFVELEKRQRFVTGDQVRILDGAFAACVGLFEGMKDTERVAVLLDLLGRKVRVVIDDYSVAAA